MIIVHVGEAWLTAPFWGTGQYHKHAYLAPSEEGWHVVAEKGVSLEEIKNAIYFVDEATALRNLEKLGCTLLTTPPEFKRRVGEVGDGVNR